jgi:hypothetical protein
MKVIAFQSANSCPGISSKGRTWAEDALVRVACGADHGSAGLG